MKYNKLIILSFAVFAFISTSVMGQSFSESQLANSEISVKADVHFYPNPAIEYLIIEVSDSQLADTEFEIHSIIGNKMKITPEQVSSGKFRIRVKDFNPGYYFLVVKDEDRRFNNVYKFLKK